MKDDSRHVTAEERELLQRTARSRSEPYGLVQRAQIVLDCADVGVAEAAKRSDVSTSTAAKWSRRFLESGLDGLRDSPRSGRPSATAHEINTVLGYALVDPPDGARRWSTRLISRESGLSQATVSRIRRRFYPVPDPDNNLFPDTSTAILTYIDVQASGCALGFQRAPSATTSRTPTPALIDSIETVSCAALLRRPYDGYSQALDPRAVRLLGRVAELLPRTAPVTLLIDVPLDAAAKAWLAQHPGLTVRSLSPESWLTSVRQIAEHIDSRQLPQLQLLQHQIRHAHRRGDTEFTWVRSGGSTSLETPLSDLSPRQAPEPVEAELSRVIGAICAEISAGGLFPGNDIPIRPLARRTGMSPSRTADVLDMLSSEAILNREGNTHRVPVPNARDVIETYTARGLLGTAIFRRLASGNQPLPPTVEDLLRRLVACDRMQLESEAYMVDLDFQNEIARAAGTPRIGWMFMQLTLQLRLFTTIIGFHFRYPTAEIVADGRRLVDGCRSGDPEVAVAAWRRKTDNCARRMLAYLETMTGAEQEAVGRPPVPTDLLRPPTG